jgi:hypothetical protein
MTRTHARILLTAAALVAGGCAESPTAPEAASLSLADAFATATPGFDALTSSYAATGATNTWVPGQLGAMMHRGGGPGGPGGPGGRGGPGGPGGPGGRGPGFGGLMGGGLGGDFSGGAFGRGFGHGPFGGGAACTGTFTAGRVNCADVTADGLTLTRSIAYTNAAGAAQAAFDTLTTNTVNVRTTVSGTRTFTPDSGRDGRGGHLDHGRGRGFGFLADSGVTITRATTTVQSSSDRTVGGLAPASTQRTVNGTSAGRESTTGTTSAGTFTAQRVMGDTVRGVIVPVVASGVSYPTAGTVIRAMQATVTYSGQAARSATRREVITYNGTATATVVITENGTVRNCTLPLPRGRLTCS